jgi:hypothetical protein
MRPLTGNIDADRLILSLLPDNELLSICEMKNKYIKVLCSAEYIWYDRLVEKMLKINSFRREPLDPDTFIQEMAVSISNLYPNITTYKQMYKYLSTFNISLNFLNMITQNIPDLYPILKYTIELKEATRLEASNITMKNGKIALTEEYNDQLENIYNRIVLIKPEILNLIRTYILPLYRNAYTTFTSGYTRYLILDNIIYTYLTVIDVPDEWFSLFFNNSIEFEDGVLYPDVNVLDPNMLNYIDYEGRVINGESNDIRIQMGNPKYNHLIY